MCLNYQGATVACRIDLSNLSKDLLQHYFVKLPFEKSISVLFTNPVDNFVDNTRE
jgi:hypothetical protein